MSTDTNYSSCRVCLNAFNVGISLDKNKKMLEVYEFCIGYAVDLHFSPKTICQKCVDEVDKFAKFKRKCAESEELWKSIYKYNIQNDSNITYNVKEEEMKYPHDDEEIFEGTLTNKSDIQQSKIESNKNETALNIINNSDADIKIENAQNIEHPSFDNKKYMCGKCKKVYCRYKWLLTHKMNVCYKHKYKETVETLKHDKKIARSAESNESDQSCGLCRTPLSDIKGHLDEHWQSNDLTCKLCDFTGRDFADMVTHRHVHCKKTKLFCHACNKKTASILSLQFHFRSVHLHKMGGLCSICSKTFTKFKTFKKHVRLHNEENRLFICDICGKKFLYRHEIKSHLIDHSNVRQFVCEACGKDFKRMSALKDHISNMHHLNTPVKCSHCSRTYKSQSKLNLHLKKIAKDKLFFCEVCSKRFLTENVLKKHMFWHTGERPYSCEVCGSKYKAKGQLNLHMRNHTGFMPHKCPDCGKCFPTGKQLKRHRSVHTGIRAHKCLHCDRSFHEKKALLEHSSLHKNIDSVKLET